MAKSKFKPKGVAPVVEQCSAGFASVQAGHVAGNVTVIHQHYYAAAPGKRAPVCDVLAPAQALATLLGWLEREQGFCLSKDLPASHMGHLPRCVQQMPCRLASFEGKPDRRKA